MSGLGTAELVAVGAVLAVVLVLVAVGGSQVYANAARAKDQLANAAALGTRGASPANGVPPGVATVRASGTISGGDGGDSTHQTVAQLNQYYAANLSQGQAMFWASFVSMVAGFAIVFAGIVMGGANGTTAIVGGIAGVLSQFIAATFLVALRSTQAQATAYAQTLVELRLRDLRAADEARATELGLELLGDISGEGAAALMNQTRAALAMGLIVKQVPAAAAATTPAPLADGDDDAIRARAAGARIPTVTFDGTATGGMQSSATTNRERPRQ